MVKVKTFKSYLTPHLTSDQMEELADLDKQVNDFIAGNSVEKVISVSDALITGLDGETEGITRVITYEEG